MTDKIHLYSLYLATKTEVAAARRAAAKGDKDNARKRLRFIQNSCIIELLKPLDMAPLPVDVPHLEWCLREGLNECHPQVQGTTHSDFEHLAANMDKIAILCARSVLCQEGFK